jgi:hypothetical protein
LPSFHPISQVGICLPYAATDRCWCSYTTLLRLSIEYASAVWDLFNKNQISQLEYVQRRAARFVSNNFQVREPGTVTSMISNLKWESLEQRRTKVRTVKSVLKSECNYFVHVRTVQLKLKSYLQCKSGCGTLFTSGTEWEG